MQNKNDIIAKEKNLKELLGQHYTLDYYQREYNWGKEQVLQLMEDLQTAFFENYDQKHSTENVREYGTYYMGPVVFSLGADNGKAIVDGQQRLTSLSLLLLCLEHRQKEQLKTDEQVEIRELIYADDYGTPKFKIRDRSRDRCMRALLDEGDFSPRPEDTASVKNMKDRYDDITGAFDDSSLSDAKVLRAFIYWLIDKVILVDITAGTDDKAYLVFETMNDRGLRLTAVEMLKAYLISGVADDKKQEINRKWRDLVHQMNEQIKQDAGSVFFQAWLRAHYAKTYAQSISKDKNYKDFEKIGTRFHVWVREKKKDIEPTENWHDFIDRKMVFFVKWFMKYHRAMEAPVAGLEHLYRIKFLGFAESLLHPLLLAPLKENDDEETVKRKLNMVARYIETFGIRKKVNFARHEQRYVRVQMYELVKKIRFKDLPALGEALKGELEKMPDTLNGIVNSREDGPEYGPLRKHYLNGKFIKFFLACLTAHIEQKSGMDSSLRKYMEPKGKPYEIEHILANKYHRYKKEFDEKEEFERTRNRVGGLILVPQGTNQSYSAAPYGRKVKHYLKENLLAQSLCKECYERNPNFINNNKGLTFKSYEEFGKKAIEERQELYKQIAEEIWDLSFFDV